MASTLADPTNYLNPPGAGPLRPGGVSVGSPTPEADLPSTPSPAVKKQMPALTIARDLSGGNERVKACGPLYLPKAPGESQANYAIRLARSVFFNVFGKAIEGLCGFVFAKDPVLGDDVPAIIKEHWENIDLQGTHGDVFARDLLHDDLTAGHCAIHVEYPQTDGTQTAADERGPNAIRPYWIPIKKDNIVSWRTANENGRLVLSQLVLKECQYVADGRFGEKEQERYRVLYRENGVVGWVLLEITKERTVLMVDGGTYPTQTEIPVAEIVSSGRESMFVSDPPLIDLGYLNIAHYQMWSDYAIGIHKTNVPVLTLMGFIDGSGETPTQVVVGPNTVLQTTNVEAKAAYISHDGAALGATKQALDDLKSDMAILSIAMLAPSKRAAETAEAKRIDKAAESSALAVTARGLQDGFERALGFHAKYLRIASGGGSLSINRDFDNTVLDAATMSAMADFAVKLNVPVRTILEELQKGGRFVGVNLDELEQEIEANQAAAQDQARMDAEHAAQLAADAAAANGGQGPAPKQVAA